MKTITVKGTGTFSASPDLIRLTLSITSIKKDYDESVEDCNKRISALKKAIEKIGFDSKDLKTVSYNISTQYKSEYDKNHNYKQIFIGYRCAHSLSLEFDFDLSRLGKLLSATASCITEPEINIVFTVKDKNAVSEELLKSACEDAKRKAEILAKASGVSLGDLISIDYSWSDINLYSDTSFEPMMCKAIDSECSAPEIEPENISTSDTATFIWEMK